jgi:hypothetical protein
VFKKEAATLDREIVFQRDPGVVVPVIVEHTYDTQFIFLALQKLPADIPGTHANGGLPADLHHGRVAHIAHMGIPHSIILPLGLTYHTGTTMSSKRKKCLPLPAGIFIE